MHITKFIEVVRHICDDALKGDLKLTEFYSLWPEGANIDSFLEQVYEDIEDLIQHTPASLFGGRIDFARLHNSQAYLTVYLDRILLNHSSPTDKLWECRRIVLNQGGLDKEGVKQLARRCLGDE